MSTEDFVLLMVTASTLAGGFLGWVGATTIMRELERRNRRQRAKEAWIKAWRHPRR